MADTPSGETVVSDEPKNNATTTTPPATDKPVVDNSEVERLRKEAENATMRANQLANQLKAKEDAEAARLAKELEDTNQFKTLYEQTNAKLKEVEAEREAADRAATLKAETDKLFAQYPETVRTLAQEAGMTLTDTDEDAVNAFKAKLDKVNNLVKQPKVTANNPGSSQPTAPDMSNDEMQSMLKDPKKFEEYMKKNRPGIASMMKPTAE